MDRQQRQQQQKTDGFLLLLPLLPVHSHTEERKE